MLPLLQAYLIALLTLSALDGLWLGLLMRDMYAREMGALMADPVRWLPAVLFYLGYPMGVLALVLSPHPASLGLALIKGATLGLVAYGTYNLTGAAVIKGWSTQLALIDIAWGATLTAAMAGAAYYWTSRNI